MANRNARLALTTSAADAYTCPDGKTALVTMCQVANVDGSNPAVVTVWWTDASASNAVTRLCLSTTVIPGDAISVVAGGLVLEAGDKIRASASATGDAEMSVCVIEEDA
ncbi:hypothetical protein L1787_16475 [Acuticoccus sp. M5D2P5]|uniref:hypothetical protein n=1 Tax=Acuticoccus kalidii TaxID=2910977 RepID=UPI001F1910A2|nr:hypothetical protein [Acuticoccus kalidii]MCF3935001.1 hypothetical protein [Acuticoccus kalidii]